MSTPYQAGRAFELRVKRALETDGYWVHLAPGSKGIDAIAAKNGDWLVISIKRSKGTIPPAERDELLAVAAIVQARPIVAHQPEPRKPIRYRQLTGPGPKQWQPWTPDQVGRPV